MTDPNTPPPTLQDVAKAAGVSRSAAGYAMRNHPMVSAATCTHVQAVAERLGYRPNPLVSTLMARVRKARPVSHIETLAYLTFYPEKSRWRRIPSQLEFFEGARGRAERLGFSLEEFCAAERGMSGSRLSDILHARGIRGVILGPLPEEHPGVMLRWERFALAAIGYSQRGVDLHRVTFDHYHAAQLALRKLAEGGARRLGLAVPAPDSERTDHLWEAAFTTFMKHASGVKPVRLFLPALADWTADNFFAWLEREKPDAVLTGQFAPRWLLLRRPELLKTIRVAAINHRGFPAPVCGIDQHNREVGAAAVDVVVGQLHHNEHGLPSRPRLVLLEGEWVDPPPR